MIFDGYATLLELGAVASHEGTGDVLRGCCVPTR
jgi:hypothetical protein